MLAYIITVCNFFKPVCRLAWCIVNLRDGRTYKNKHSVMRTGDFKLHFYIWDEYPWRAFFKFLPLNNMSWLRKEVSCLSWWSVVYKYMWSREFLKWIHKKEAENLLLKNWTIRYIVLISVGHSWIVLLSLFSGTISTHQKKLQEAKFEIITSEASYINSLNVLEKHFISSLEACDESVLSKNDRRTLFSNLIPGNNHIQYASFH